MSFPTLPWYTFVTLAAFAVLGFSLACVIARIVLRMLYVGIVNVVQPLFLWSEKWVPVLRNITFGSAHFAKSFELKRASMFRDEGISLGTWKGKELREPVGGHIALIGPPRSRKSWGLIMPCLNTYSGSVVVSDLRGELHDKTQAAREHVGPVYRYDPGTMKSCSLNALDFVRWSTSFQYGDLMRQMKHLYPERGDIADIYRSSAVPLAISIAMHCYQQGHASYPAMLSWMLNPASTMDEKLKELLASPDLLISQGARRTLDAKPPFRQSVWTTLLEPLTIFSDAMIASHSETSDLTFEDLLYAPQPVSLFLCMGFHEISRLGIVLGLLVEALLGVVSSTETPARHPVLLVLDECANLGKLPGLERGLSYLQGSGAQCLLTFQNVAQVIQTYEPDSPLLASCSTKIYYTSNDVLTAAAVSVHGGESTVLSVSGGLDTYTRSETARVLITMDEALRLPNDQAIIFQQGVPPIRATKLGAPVPTQPVGKLAYTLRPYRTALVWAGMALVLGLTLWPLTRPVTPRQASTRVPSSTSPAPAPAVVAPTTPGPWHLLESTPSLLKDGWSLSQGTFPSQDACRAGLAQQYAPLLASLQKMARPPATVEVSQEPDKWEWTTHRGTQPPDTKTVWCEERR